MPFQASAVNNDLPLAIQGDFASINPRSAVIAGEAGLVAGAGGVTVAAFGWIQADGRTVLNAPASGTPAPDGFIHREQQALITTYLAEYSMTIQAGFGMGMMRSGDYYVLSATAAVKGNKVFASTTTGAITYGAAGATIAGYVETDFIVTVAAAANTLAVMTGLQP